MKSGKHCKLPTVASENGNQLQKFEGPKTPILGGGEDGKAISHIFKSGGLTDWSFQLICLIAFMVGPKKVKCASPCQMWGLGLISHQQWVLDAPEGFQIHLMVDYGPHDL